METATYQKSRIKREIQLLLNAFRAVLIFAFFSGGFAIIFLRNYVPGDHTVIATALSLMTDAAPVVNGLAAQSQFPNLTKLVMSIYWLFTYVLLCISVLITFYLFRFSRLPDSGSTKFLRPNRHIRILFLTVAMVITGFALADAGLIDFISFRTGKGWVDLRGMPFVTGMGRSRILLFLTGYFTSIGIGCAYFCLMIFAVYFYKVFYHRKAD